MTLRVLVAAGTLQLLLLNLDVAGEVWKETARHVLHEGTRSDQLTVPSGKVEKESPAINPAWSKLRLKTMYLSPLGIVFGIFGCLTVFAVCFSCYVCICRRRNPDSQMLPQGMSQPHPGGPITAGVMPPIYGHDNMAFHPALPPSPDSAQPWSQSTYYQQQQYQQQYQQQQQQQQAVQQRPFFPPHAYPPTQPYAPPHFVSASAPPLQSLEPPPAYVINEVRLY